MLTLGLLCVSCATTPKGPPPKPPAARSSLTAVLAHADELNLSSLQVARLSQFDDAREEKANDARNEFHSRKEGRGAPPGATSSLNPTQAGGQGLGGGSRDASGANLNGQPRRMTRHAQAALQQALDSRLDELDTQSYFLAEPFLDEAQKALAQKYATEYRVALMDYRDAIKEP
jgi:hypothetical protein